MLELLANINNLLSGQDAHGESRRSRHSFPLRCERPGTNLYYNYCNEDNYLGVTQVVRVYLVSRRLKNAQKLRHCFSRQKPEKRKGDKL